MVPRLSIRFKNMLLFRIQFPLTKDDIHFYTYLFGFFQDSSTMRIQFGIISEVILFIYPGNRAESVIYTR